MTLDVAVEGRAGGFALSAAFRSEGRVTALFGRSGAGKTTLVNMIAGLVKPTRGRIVIDGMVLFDSAAGVNLPAHTRRIGYVFQEGRLFPHYSVSGNLLYGAASRTPPDFDAVVDLLGIGDLLSRRPATLSGGEKQRVALGRALLAAPRLLLMDEPLAALDETRKDEIIPYIERLRDHARIPIVYVSHALPEVVRLADTIVVLGDGRVVASGSVEDVLSRTDLGGAIGRDALGAVLTATIAGHDAAAGTTTLDHPAGRITHPLLTLPAGTRVRLRIRARDVALAVGEPGRLSIRNRLAATVTGVVPGAAPDVDVILDLAGDRLVATVTATAARELGLAQGLAVTALVKAASFDRPAAG